VFKSEIFQSVILCLFLTLAACGGEEPPGNASSTGTATDPGALTKSAVKKQEIGAFEEAVELLDRALKIEPTFLPALYRKGQIYEEWDQRQEAIRAYQKALEIEPAHEGALLGLGSVYSKSNRNDRAIQEYKKLAALRPNDPEVLFKIALEYWYIQELPKSAEYYRKVIEIDPDHMQAHLNLISVYERMKDWENAIDEIEIARTLGKRNNDAQAIAIAERKLHFIKGRMNLTDQEMNRKTQPPFD
jgi:tetratricopeptide (TPR) repeat protein